MGIVTHANTFYTGLGKLLFDAEECILAGILRHVNQLLRIEDELVDVAQYPGKDAVCSIKK